MGPASARGNRSGGRSQPRYSAWPHVGARRPPRMTAHSAARAPGAPVFISYVRRTSASHAVAVHRRTGGEGLPVFLDTLQTASGEGSLSSAGGAPGGPRRPGVPGAGVLQAPVLRGGVTTAIMAYRTLLRGLGGQDCAAALRPIVRRATGRRRSAGGMGAPAARAQVGNWPAPATARTWRTWCTVAWSRSTRRSRIASSGSAS